jgi:predicted flap endonuclease-1-like 5' DNA nuclease
MTAYVLQTALLLGAAYFAGCFIACMIRSRIVSPARVRDEATVPMATGADLAVERAPPATPPARPVPPPPLIAQPRQAPAQPMPSPVREAFRRADTLEPVSTAALESADARPEGSPPATPKVDATTAAVGPAPPPPSAPPPPPAASSTAAAAAAAAAMAAAAARREPTPRPAPPGVPPSPPAPQPVRSIVPSSAPLAAPPPAAAPPRQAPSGATAPTADSKPDDLKRIRLIDATLEAALNRLGIRRYSDIARWRPEDVARISQALGFKGRIEQENWIEQAQILARGEETFYSRRLARGEQPSARPVTDEGVRREPPLASATPPAPAVTETQRSRASVEAAAAAAAALAAAAAASQQRQPQVEPATRPTAPAGPSQAPPVTPEVTPAPAVEERAAFARPGQPAPGSDERSPATPPADAPASSAPAAAAPIGAGRDNLQRIGGINAEVERLLNLQGITRYSQIAGWGRSEIERFDGLLGQAGRIQRENWVEQAQILARGGDTAYSREYDRRLSEEPQREDAARPARLADALREPQSVRPTPDPRPRTSDLSSLRSVRSEAFRPAEAPAPGTGARPNDLKAIRGIGVLIEKKLNSMGITTYAQIANWSAADIERVSQALDFKGRIERENWVEQARILAAGGQTEFSRRAGIDTDRR